jgi:hypothetical protein
MEGDVLRGRQAALRFVIANGVPVALRLIGRSMEPTLPRGSMVRVATLQPSEVLEVGDVVAIAAAAGDEVIVHRVLHAFAESGRDFIVHQGDAPGTSFAVASRQQVLARVIALDDGTPDSRRPIGRGDRCRFGARRLVSRGYLLARVLVDRMGVSPRPALRRASRRLRSIAAAVLERDGAPALWSSLVGESRHSVRAYRAAGLTVVRRTFDVRVGETSVRALARRIIFGK